MRRLLLALLVLTLIVLAALAGAIYWIVGGDGARLALERQLSAWLGQPVTIEDAGVVLYPRPGISLAQVRIGDPAAVTLGRVELSTGLRALLSRRVEDAETVISSSRIEMPLPFSWPPAASSSDAAAGGVAASALELVSIRRILLSDVVLVSRGREIEVDADSSLSDRRLEIGRFVATAGDVEIEARGSVDFGSTVNASLVASSPLLDLDALLAVVAAFTGRREEGAEPRLDVPRLNLRVTAPRARAAGVDLRDFDAVVTAQSGEIAIEPMSFGLFGGHHEGWIEVTLGEPWALRIGSSVTNIDVAELAAFGGAPGTVSGRLSGMARLGASGNDLASVLRSARGVGDVEIADGTVARLELVRTVANFLGRAPEGARQTGNDFRRLTASFAIADRRVTTEDLTMTADDIDVLARGSLDLDGKRLEGNASLVLSPQLSAGANPTLYRFTEMGSRVVLPAIIGGTLGQPQVTIDAAAAIRRGVTNEIERRLRNLFERSLPF